MARQQSSRLSLIFAFALAGTACGGSDNGGGGFTTTPFGNANPGHSDAGAAAAGGGATSLGGGTTTPLGGGTTTPLGGGTTTPLGGGIASGGGAAAAGGTGTPGGTPGATATPGGADAGHADGGAVATPGGGGDAGVPGGGTGSKDGGASTDSGAPVMMGKGDCCPDGNCLCQGTPPKDLSFAPVGPYKTASLQLATGVAYYPTGLSDQLGGVAICPGFLNVGPEMTDWGPFYASYGIVCVVTDTGAADLPEIRAGLLAGSIEALKAENKKSGSPLNNKMSGRYGTTGYSMGGGGTTMAAAADQSLKSSVALAPWEPVGTGKVPSLVFCGDVDVVAPCDYADGSYADTPDSTPKMHIVISGADHLTAWFGPQDGGGGTSGMYALAFQKVYLLGDTRWKSLLITPPFGHNMITNIK